MAHSPIAAFARAATLFGVCLMATLLLLTSCVRLPRAKQSATAHPPLLTRIMEESPGVNLNTASREELGRLPGVGVGIAARIIEYREKFGPFRRSEHLLMVRGVSERRFKEMRPFIRVEVRLR